MKVIYLTRDSVYINENDRIVKKEFSYEKGITTSVLSYKSILNLTFKLPKNIEKEMLEIEAEKYVFTEGSLDYNKEYKINYKFREFEEYFNVEAFVVETETLKKEFEHILKTYKYIDFISAAPFVFKSYYEITDTDAQNDVFISFTEEEAFLSCFEKGEFVFVKTISKLSNLAKQLDLDVNECADILRTKGLNEEKYEDREVFNTVEAFFSQFFMKVNNLINYSVGYYGFSKIDRIYFYSSFGIECLFDNYVDFWNLSGIEFKKYEIPSEYDPFDYTVSVYNAKNYENEDENFSIFHKPLVFYKTKTGILSVIFTVCMLFLGVDAAFKYQTLKRQESRMLSLHQQLKRKQKEKSLLKSAIIKYKKKISSVTRNTEALQKQISDISDKIIFLENIQKKPLSANLITDLINGLKLYNLKLLSFEKDNSHIALQIVSKFDNSANIAEFMKYLYKLGYKNIYSSSINNKDGIYISEVGYDE